MTANLLPCPFCGAKTDPESVCYGEVDGIDAEAICCPECESQGPYGINNAIAVESWNKRATHERQPAASTQLADELDEMREELFADMKPGVELLDRVVAFLRAAHEPPAECSACEEFVRMQHDIASALGVDADTDSIDLHGRIYGAVSSSQPPSVCNCLAVINALIKPGELQGNGCDEAAQRNGVILAFNAVAAHQERHSLTKGEG